MEILSELLGVILQIILEGFLPDIIRFLFKVITMPVSYITAVTVLYLRYRDHLKVKQVLRRYHRGSFVIAGHAILGNALQSSLILLCCSGVVAALTFGIYKMIMLAIS